MEEHCGVIGIVSTNDVAKRLHRGLFALQHRGQEAAGIAVFDKNLSLLKGKGLVYEALPQAKVESIKGNIGIGHVRYSTVKVESPENIHPICGNTPYGKIAIAHNGNIKNAEELRSDLEKAGTIFNSTVDTELFIHLIAQSKCLHFHDALAHACDMVEGSYSLAIFRDGQVYGLRDPYGIRPLVIGNMNDGMVIASETCALESIGAKYYREVLPGELIYLMADRFISSQLLKPKEQSSCIFELVYFARPNSNVFGQNVYSARTRMGCYLAEQDIELNERELNKPDMVIPIPDSGVPAAIGYSQASGIPIEQAIVRSHYIGRTFILPDQDARQSSLALKLSVISDIVKDKKVILIDDSIVRGNTSKLIVQMVRDAGAKEVWLRVSSPPVSNPCYLGIDTPDKDELIINQFSSLEEIKKFIGVDSLRYLSLEGLRKSVYNESFCEGCLTGKYPI